MLVAGAFSFTACSDDDDYSVATGNIISAVETGDASVTTTTATISGTVLDLSKYDATSYEVGTIYGTNQDPTTSGTKKAGSLDTSTGSVSTTITGLTKGVKYYYATYVTLQGKVTKYGDVKEFTTVDAQIVAADASNITSVGATLGGTVDNEASILNEGSSTISYGVKIATTEGGILDGADLAEEGTSLSFSVPVEELLPGRTYHYAAYYKLGDGYVFSDTKSFTTASKDMEYVDLGLSVMWAKYNIGAESETDLGGLYGYGDITGMSTSEYLTDYATGDISGTDNDIATSISAAIDGQSENKSQTPTQEQWEELISKTTQEFTNIDGIDGMKFTANNGNYIFLPVGGYREGETCMGEGNIGLYWTGNVNTISSDYANTVNMTSTGGAVVGLSKRSLGLSVRSVRAYDAATELAVDNTKIKFVNKEDNGVDARLEIYNEYGPTQPDPGINTSQIKFSKNMLVTFTLSGIDGEVDCYGGLEFADASWDPSLWSGFNSKYDCHVTGNGTYTVWMETNGATAEGAVVFCVDIANLYQQLGADKFANVKAEVNSIKFDVDDSQMQYYVDNSNVLFCNKDGNGTDGRIEIYNEYGDTKGLGVNVSDMSFSGYLIVTYTISGIDGNLVDGATKDYKSELSYATPSWYPSYWGGTDFAAATVTGDGTYTVFAPISAAQGTCTGAVVWTIEIYNLWKDLVDTSKVKATIDSVVIPGKVN